MKECLSFDDVLLIPEHNTIQSRKDVNISTVISKYLTLKLPVISSCMDTVTESDMAITMWRLGGLGILHRYNSIEQQLKMFAKVQNNVLSTEEEPEKNCPANCAIAIGATGDYLERAQIMINKGANILCIDVAHGDSSIVVYALQQLRRAFPSITIIAGNVATGVGAARLLDAGADSIRVGIGGGSLCSTRRVTGFGIPTLQSVIDCAEYLDQKGYNRAYYSLLADGGIRESSDVVKSIAAGARAVILGQMLAGTVESPGQLVTRGFMVDDKGYQVATQYKCYRGMASFDAQVEWRPEKREQIVPEGEVTWLPFKGPVKKVLFNLEGGLRSGLTYGNANTLEELYCKHSFVKITNAGLIESKPHAKF